MGSGAEILSGSCLLWVTRDFSKKEAEVCPQFLCLPPGLSPLLQRRLLSALEEVSAEHRW